eukprot:SAG11_NODE_5951_length_1426_cov_1.564431_1_plen_362_part_10
MLASGEGESTAARIVTMVSACLTFIVVVLSCYDVEAESSTLVEVETTCVVYFTVEYVVRLATARHRPLPTNTIAKKKGLWQPTLTSFVIAPLNIVDMLTVLPFWITLVFRVGIEHAQSSSRNPNAVVLRILKVSRFVRMARVVKLVRYVRALTVVIHGLSRSVELLVTLFFGLLIATVLMGTLVFHVIKASNAPDKLSSVPDTFFFVLGQLADLTSISHGEVSLDSALGHTVGLVLMVAGVLFHGLAVASIMSGFRDEVKVQSASIMSKRKFRKIFRSVQSDMCDSNPMYDGHATCGDLYRALRKANSRLAIVLEDYPPDLNVTETFFQTLMQEAKDMDVEEQPLADVETLYSAAKLLQEDL